MIHKEQINDIAAITDGAARKSYGVPDALQEARHLF